MCESSEKGGSGYARDDGLQWLVLGTSDPLDPPSRVPAQLAPGEDSTMALTTILTRGFIDYAETLLFFGKKWFRLPAPLAPEKRRLAISSKRGGPRAGRLHARGDQYVMR